MCWRILCCSFVFALAAAAFGQAQPAQAERGPAPDFVAYQALFRDVIWLENQAEAPGVTPGAASAQPASIRSQFQEATGLSGPDYAVLVSIAQDYAKAHAAYIAARDAVLNAVYAQQAAGQTATWPQVVRLSSLYKQDVAMIESHVAQPASKLSAPGAQALASYVHAAIAPSVTWGR